MAASTTGSHRLFVLRHPRVLPRPSLAQSRRIKPLYGKRSCQLHGGSAFKMVKRRGRASSRLGSGGVLAHRRRRLSTEPMALATIALCGELVLRTLGHRGFRNRFNLSIVRSSTRRKLGTCRYRMVPTSHVVGA
jgi:hypothetical protein